MKEKYPILPWHREAANEILWNAGRPANENDIATIIARHDPHAETLRLLEDMVRECTPMRMPRDDKFYGVSAPSKETLERARAHLAAHSKPSAMQEATSCEGCIHRHYVTPDPMGTSRPGWGCLLSGGHAVKRCDGYERAQLAKDSLRSIGITARKAQPCSS